MNTDIYTLLGMIKDGKAPRSVYSRGNMYTYDEASNDYWCNELDTGTKWLFDEYVITDILNDKAEILETTINWKNIAYKMSNDLLNKQCEEWQKEIKQDKIEKIDIDITEEAQFGINAKIIYKINEIIDRLNKE